MSLSSFQCQHSNTQRSGRPKHASMKGDILSMTPVWGESIRPQNAQGRTADFLTPGGSSEQGIIEPVDGQPVYRRKRLYPGTSRSSRSHSTRRPSPSFAAPRPSLSSSNVSYLVPPVSDTFHGHPMSSPSAYVPNSGSLPSSFGNFATLDPTTVAFDPNFTASPDGMQAAWEHHHHQSVPFTPPEVFPFGMQTSNYPNGHPMSEASPLGQFQFYFGDWQTSATTSPSYSLTPYSASSPSTSSHGYLDTHFYPEQDSQQGPNGV